MSDHHPLVAGRLPDGRTSYIFLLTKMDGLSYLGSGTIPEKSRSLERKVDGSFTLIKPSPSIDLYLRVLRYDPDAYMHCEYYANKMRPENIGLDPTGPFSWRPFKSFYRPHAGAKAAPGSEILKAERSPEVANDDEISIHDHTDEDERSASISLCSDDDDWKTAEDGSDGRIDY